MTSNMSGLPDERVASAPSTAQLTKYRTHVAHLDLSDAAKDELLNVVWRIMGNFVDRAYGDDPVQHVNEIRGKREVRVRPVVGSRHNQQPQDKGLSGAFTSPAAGRGRKERS